MDAWKVEAEDWFIMIVYGRIIPSYLQADHSKLWEALAGTLSECQILIMLMVSDKMGTNYNHFYWICSDKYLTTISETTMVIW